MRRPAKIEVRSRDEVKGLIKQLQTPDEETLTQLDEARHQAWRGYSAFPMIEMLQERQTRLQAAAAEALGEFNDVRAIAALVEAFDDQREIIRWTAARSLAKIGTPAVPALVKALKDKREQVCWAAEEALSQIEDPADASLIGALADEDMWVRWAAAVALGRTGDPRAVPILFWALDRREAFPFDARSPLYYKAAYALGEMARRNPVPELRAALPRLRRLSRIEDTRTASFYQRIIGRIEEATEQVKDLPVTVAAVPYAAEDLPLPARQETPSPDRLPIPTGEPGSEKPSLRSWRQRLRQMLSPR